MLAEVEQDPSAALTAEPFPAEFVDAQRRIPLGPVQEGGFEDEQ